MSDVEEPKKRCRVKCEFCGAEFEKVKDFTIHMQKNHALGVIYK